MPPSQSIWYRLGFALERARPSRPAPTGMLRGLAQRATERRAAQTTRERGGREPDKAVGWPKADDLIASSVTAAVARLLGGWRPRRKSGVTGLLRAGLAGAAAALLLDLTGPLLKGEARLRPFDQGTGDRMLAGLGQGLIYGAVIEPRMPGPALMKGAIYGTAEYAVDTAGGLSHLLGPHAPQGRFPAVARFLEELDPHDRAYVEHVVFGIALAVLYGSSDRSSGIRLEVEAE